MRLGPRPTAHASATHRSTESQDRSSFGQQGWNAGPLALSPSCTLVFCSERSHTTQPCPASTQKGPIFVESWEWGRCILAQACGLWASRRAQQHPRKPLSTTRACQQAHRSNKLCGTEVCLCGVGGGAAEGGRLWAVAGHQQVCCREQACKRRKEWFPTPGSIYS